MSEPVQNFRTAFHGFNREDVVRFLETATARHTAEVNQLRDEIARLEGDLSLLRMRSGDGASQEELEALQAENARLKARWKSWKPSSQNRPPPQSATRPTGKTKSWPPTAGQRLWSARPGTGRRRCITGSMG